MNHLPQKDAEHIRVPFVAKRIVYTPDDFFSLPGKYQCSGAQLVQEGPGLLPELPADVAPTFLQEWIFFSLLSQVLNQDVDSRQFLKEENGRTEVDTSGIITLFDRSLQVSPSPSLGDGHDWNHQTRAILALEEARSFVLAWCSDKYLPLGIQSESESRLPSPNVGRDCQFRAQHPELCISFGIMGETLDRFCARHRQWSLPRNDPEPYGGWENCITDQRSWGVSNPLRERMIKMGWCPYEVRRIGTTTGDLSSMYYISSFQPVIRQDHSTCSDVACALDPWNGFNMHSDDCPGSAHSDRLLPDQVELVRIIEAGNIPLLSLDDRTSLVLTEHVLGQTPNLDGSMAECAEQRFVAISHVWSDGLGPSDGRGLPRCQLARIKRTLMKDSELDGLPFWIDSLCIPMQQDIRNKAIQMMGEIYSRAHTVLVLDSTLRSMSVNPDENSKLEAIVRINTGIWCTRMWTLPEGVQAQNVHFDFEDGLLSIQKLRRHYKDAKHDPMHREHHVYKAGWVFSPSIFILRYETDEDGVARKTTAKPDRESIGHLWLSMQWRQTSRPDDETLCLARLLDLDPLPILRASAPATHKLAEQRMVEFLDLMDQSVGIPPGMIFLPGPKLPVRGFAWAPRSWMTMRSRDAGAPLLVAEQRLSFLTRRGLQVQYPGIQLHPGHRGGAAEPRSFWIPTARNLRSWLRIDFAPDSPSHGGVWKTVWNAACAGAELPCIIRSRFDQHDEPEVALLVKGLSRRRETAAEGSARAMGQNRGDVFWVQSLCRVWIQLETDNAVVAKRAEDFRLHVDAMTWGEMLDGDQRWVVDGNADEVGRSAS